MATMMNPRKVPGANPPSVLLLRESPAFSLMTFSERNLNETPWFLASTRTVSR